MECRQLISTSMPTLLHHPIGAIGVKSGGAGVAGGWLVGKSELERSLDSVLEKLSSSTAVAEFDKGGTGDEKGVCDQEMETGDIDEVGLLVEG